MGAIPRTALRGRLLRMVLDSTSCRFSATTSCKVGRPSSTRVGLPRASARYECAPEAAFDVGRHETSHGSLVAAALEVDERAGADVAEVVDVAQGAARYVGFMLAKLQPERH